MKQQNQKIAMHTIQKANPTIHNFTEVSGTGMDVVPVPAPVQTSIPVPAVHFCRRAELTEVFGTSVDVVPTLPKFPIPVLMLYRTYRTKCPVSIILAYTGGMPRYVPYRTHARKND